MRVKKMVVPVLLLALAAAGPARAEVTKIRCESTNDKYKYCATQTDNQVRMLEQVSEARCDQGTSWGFDKDGVWVDHNCVAEFQVGRSGPSTSQKVAAGAAAGVAVLQAFLAQGHTSPTAAAAPAAAAPDESGGTLPQAAAPRESVRTYQALEPKSGAQVYLRVDDRGLLEGRAKEKEFFGRVKGDKIYVGADVFSYRMQPDGVLVFRPGKEASGVLFTPVQ
jgi:hypothetical protein